MDTDKFTTRYEANLKNLLNEGKHYDAHQVLRTILPRLASRSRQSEALQLCIEYGKLFLTKYGEHALAADLGCRMIDILRDQNPVFSAEASRIILDFYNVSTSSSYELIKFLDKATQWSQTSAPPVGDRDLHLALGIAYQNLGDYGNAQAHLIYCIGEEERLAKLLQDWAMKGYKSEKDFFTLRAILMLIAVNNLQTADNLLRLNFVEDHIQDCAPLQFAYFITQAAKTQDAEFLEMVKSKYQLLIRRDPSYDILIREIERTVFNISRRNNGFLQNAGNIFASFSGAMAAAD